MKIRQKSPKQISVRKIEANRENAQKSTGPANTVSTRFNAQKHGLLSQGIIELDDAEKFQAFVEQLKAELQPVGILEEECVHQIALLTFRIRRARRLEAEAFTAYLNPAKKIHHPGTAFTDDAELIGWNETIDIGLPAQVSNDAIDAINRTVLRYETSIENKLFRWQNQLERLQRLRRGESIPAPANVELNVHTAGEMASFGNSPASG
jgi:hypothetical protein